MIFVLVMEPLFFHLEYYRRLLPPGHVVPERPQSRSSRRDRLDQRLVHWAYGCIVLNGVHVTLHVINLNFVWAFQQQVQRIFCSLHGEGGHSLDSDF